MYVKKLPEIEYGVNITIKTLGGKWKPCLLDCIQLGIHRPSEMWRAIPGSTLRVLSQQLKEMEETNIVYKKIYAEVPLRVEYHLTEWGSRAIAIINMMNKWGNDYAEAHGDGQEIGCCTKNN
ncbi:MAG: helix-turn-helix transcriptional regulator [Chitinophaga sp.]|uniref:winged helix-turn-helix transcriptional regulator n=1 Tax=Chitinophaga sp. TaxID=1869181 RepID=UPI001B2D900C|nr:helix-turn-helix domain-containing protein [Chitinophaga sp.]MBO9727962.1 helix-turn-helix transcriptional regulator [Chitinophaga sp.]